MFAFWSVVELRNVYEKPALTFEMFDVEDVITMSGGDIGTGADQQEEPVTSVDIFEQAPNAETFDNSALSNAVEGLYENMISDQ